MVLVKRHIPHGKHPGIYWTDEREQTLEVRYRDSTGLDKAQNTFKRILDSGNLLLTGLLALLFTTTRPLGDAMALPAANILICAAASAVLMQIPALYRKK